VEPFILLEPHPIYLMASSLRERKETFLDLQTISLLTAFHFGYSHETKTLSPLIDPNKYLP